MRRGSASVAAIYVAIASVGCQQASLSQQGSRVATAQSAPVDAGWDPASCRQLGYLVGRGGGAVGGGWIPNEQLVAYAMNDLRNKAAAMGANYVQHDSPAMGVTGSNGSTTTSTATVSGTAYQCTRMRDAGEGEVAAKHPACVKGVTQACVGPGGCSGGQACLPDGSGFGPCDCGGSQKADEPVCNPECPRGEVCRQDHTCGMPF
jgi:hypothetical protein